MTITNLISYVNIYHIIRKNVTIGFNRTKFSLDSMFIYWKSTCKNRKKFFRSNHFLILCILSLIFCLYLNQQYNSNNKNSHLINNEKNIESFINRIRDIAILDQNYVFNITSNLTGNDLPKSLYQYKIAHLFNFYWYHNDGYLWHLQRIMDFKQIDRNKITHQKYFQDFDQTDLFDYLTHHPENGIFIDTASDPIQPLFPSLPQSSLPLEETCEQYSWLNNWYPCHIRSEMISSFSFKPLITYALYDVTLDIHNQASLAIYHYDEIIFLFKSHDELLNETFFIRQILPRLIRLLILVPKTAMILLPYLNSKVYINQYLDILIERGLIEDKKRFIEYNPNQIYHTNVLYSTSSPRSDISLLNQILIGDKLPLRRELILIIRNNFNDDSYNEIIRTLNQFELSEEYQYLHMHEHNEKSSDDIKQTGDLFRQARIVIGMPTDILSYIVWCQRRTHIIEIIHENITTDYYEISLQLQFTYWLVQTTKTNKIDIVDFRNLMMKVLMDIDA